MNRLAHHFWLAAMSLGFVPIALAANIPESYPPERYDSLWQHSPFTLSAISDEQAGPSGLAERYSLAGAFSIGKKNYVFVVEKANPQERILVSEEPNDKSLALESLQYDAILANTTAKIRMGTEVGVLKFDQALLSAPAPGPGAVAMPSVMPNPPPNINRTFPNQNPARVIRRPRTIAPPPSMPPR